MKQRKKAINAAKEGGSVALQDGMASQHSVKKSNKMKAASQCEHLFSRAEELGTGVAALGDMLQWASADTYQDTSKRRKRQ